MMPVPETRASLLLRLRDPRDQSAWETFLQIYQPLIFGLARRRGMQEADAREVTQDVLMAVAGAIGSWEVNPERGSFRGWLARITRNLVVNFFIRQSRHPRGSGDSDLKRWLEERPDPHCDESALFSREEQHQTLRWASEQVLREFRKPTWSAFWQTAVENRDAAAVAEDLGVSVGMIYVSRSRVMKRLREKVQERFLKNEFETTGNRLNVLESTTACRRKKLFQRESDLPIFNPSLSRVKKSTHLSPLPARPGRGDRKSDVLL